MMIIIVLLILMMMMMICCPTRYVVCGVVATSDTYVRMCVCVALFFLFSSSHNFESSGFPALGVMHAYTIYCADYTSSITLAWCVFLLYP